MHSTQERILNLFDNQGTINKNYRQIGKAIGEEHPETIKHHIEQLQKKGLVKVDDVNKLISVVKAGQIANSSLVAVPIVGSANCGEATIYADEDVQGYLKLSRTFLGNKKGVIAVKASGNSMNRADIEGKSINDGDYVLIDCEDKSVRDGDYILSVIDGLANIKKFVKDRANNQIVLLSESTMDYPPIFVDPSNYNYLINGKVVNVLKNPNE